MDRPSSPKLLTSLPIVLFAALILFSHPAKAQTSGYAIKKQKTVTGWDRACTYYNITHTGLGIISPNAFVNGSNLSAVNWKSAEGKMNNYKWEWKVNESYEKPVYKRVCNPWNETVANGTNTTVITHSNCTRKLDHNETRYKTSWKEHPSIANLFGGSSQLVRLCGDVEVGETENGWGYSIYHAVNFNGNIYPKMTWWNESWARKRNVTFTEQSGNDLTNYPVETTLYIEDEKVQSDCDDVRVISPSGNEIEFNNSVCNSTYNTTHTEVGMVHKINVSASSTANYSYYYNNSNATQSAKEVSYNDAWYNFWDDFEDGVLKGGWTVDKNNCPVTLNGRERNSECDINRNHMPV